MLNRSTKSTFCPKTVSSVICTSFIVFLCIVLYCVSASCAVCDRLVKNDDRCLSFLATDLEEERLSMYLCTVHRCIVVLLASLPAAQN